RVEEVEAAAVDDDARRTGVDELVERVAHLGRPPHVDLSAHADDRRVAGRPRSELQFRHALHLRSAVRRGLPYPVRHNTTIVASSRSPSGENSSTSSMQRLTTAGA